MELKRIGYHGLGGLTTIVIQQSGACSGLDKPIHCCISIKIKRILILTIILRTLSARDFPPPWSSAACVTSDLKAHPHFHHTQNDHNAIHPPASVMITSGFTNAPVSQFLVFSTVIGALVTSLTDTRYYIHIQVVPHIWNYGQFWRLLTWQVLDTRMEQH